MLLLSIIAAMQTLQSLYVWNGGRSLLPMVFFVKSALFLVLVYIVYRFEPTAFTKRELATAVVLMVGVIFADTILLAYFQTLRVMSYIETGVLLTLCGYYYNESRRQDS